MQISIETTSGLERRLTISVPSQTFEEQITERLGRAAREARIPGFRPGHVPMKEVRRRYGAAVRSEVAGTLMQSSFVEAVRQEKLAPAGTPNLEVVKMDPGIDFEFTATFEVFPTIELSDLTQMVIDKPQAEITEKDVDEAIEQLRERRKEWLPVDRAAGDGDRVKLDFVGTMDGEVFEGGSGEDASFIIGSGQMIEDFDQGVRGLVAGEDGEFAAMFPDDYGAEALRGKEATFTVTIKEVAEPRLPELNDEFFESFGIKEGGLAAFRDDVRNNMQREMDTAVDKLVTKQVMDQLHDLHQVQLPKAMVSREIGVLKEQMLQQFQMYGGRQPQLDLPDDMFEEQAQRRVAVGLVVSEIVSTVGLSTDPQQVRERVEALAAQYAEPQQVINWYYGNEEQLQQIEMAVLEGQVVDHLLAQAQVNMVPSTYADVMSGNFGTGGAEDDDDGSPAPEPGAAVDAESTLEGK